MMRALCRSALLAAAIAASNQPLAQIHLPGPLPTEYAPVVLPHAEGGSRYRLAAGATLAHDDNVFRLPGNVSPDTVGGSGRSRSTVITRLYAQANADIPVSLQRFHGQLTANAYTFSSLSYLDYQAIDGRAGWLWRVADRLNGELRYDRTSGLADFIDARPTVKNLRTVDAILASADYAITPRWIAGTALSGSNGRNSDASLKVSDSRQRSIELRAKHLGMDENAVIGFARFTEGETPNLAPSAIVDNEYRQREIGIEVVYGLSDISNLRARVAQSERTYPRVSANDFSGMIGRLDFNWGLSPVSGLRFNVRRELAAFIEVDSSYYVNTAFGVSPWWSVTPKIKLELNLERWNRDYRGPQVGGTRRADVLNFARLALRWSPLQNLQLTGGVTWSRRDSNVDSFDFVDRVVFGQLEWAF